MTEAARCAHEVIEASVEITRLTAVEGGPVVGYQSSIQVTCKGCEIPFEFMGTPVGLSPRMPMTDVAGTELRAPLRPIDAPRGFGESGAGFHVTVPRR